MARCIIRKNWLELSLGFAWNFSGDTECWNPRQLLHKCASVSAQNEEPESLDLEIMPANLGILFCSLTCHHVATINDKRINVLSEALICLALLALSAAVVPLRWTDRSGIGRNRGQVWRQWSPFGRLTYRHTVTYTLNAIDVLSIQKYTIHEATCFEFHLRRSQPGMVSATRVRGRVRSARLQIHRALWGDQTRDVSGGKKWKKGEKQQKRWKTNWKGWWFCTFLQQSPMDSIPEAFLRLAGLCQHLWLVW